MAYKNGEIYFVRETVWGSEEFSSFVKIGLVALDRSSEDRLKEHQTGNPRKLKNQEVVKTDAVHRVEALLHKFFAPHRVSGEWFDFKDEKLVLEAIAKTKSLSKEMKEFVPLFEKAEALADKPSEGDEIASNSKIKEIATRYALASTKLKLCSAIQSEIKNKFAVAIAAGADVKGAATETTVTPTPKFSVTALKKDHKDVYEKYADQISSWSGPFKVTIDGAARDELDQEFLDQLTSIEEMIAAVNKPEDAYKLNEPNLLVTNLKALAEWDFDLAEAELKNECGLAPGITGICSWVRKVTTRASFNQGKFAQEMPELWVEYTLPRESYTKLSVSRKKN